MRRKHKTQPEQALRAWSETVMKERYFGLNVIEENVGDLATFLISLFFYLCFTERNRTLSDKYMDSHQRTA